jgi:hypothetical protein
LVLASLRRCAPNLTIFLRAVTLIAGRADASSEMSSGRDIDFSLEICGFDFDSELSFWAELITIMLGREKLKEGRV